jgi:N-acetylglutamate synthase-like GNAT family acetyltransferase
MASIKIIDYEDQYQQNVKELNYEWLLKYDLLEPMDDEYLDYPREMILNKGGFILLAETEGIIVGTISAVPIEAGCMELENFAVSEKMQGQKIGRMLLEKCIETAKIKGTRKLTLYTNSQLANALALYKKMGFVIVEPKNKKFMEADMALELNI